MATSAASSTPPVTERQQQRDEAVLHLRGDARGHAEVDQREPAVVGEQHVAGVRVGVDEAVDQDLVEVGAEQRAGERRPVHLHQAQRTGGADAGARRRAPW